MGVHHASAGTAVAFLIPVAVYLAFATRTIQGGDSAEFALLALRGGVPHPPGYPVYAALARVAGALPFEPPAWRAAVPSALAGASAVCLLFRIGLALTDRVVPSLAGAFAFAFAPLAWKLAGVPEVFSLHAMFAAAIVLAAMRLREVENEQAVRAAHLFGWIAGLGLANHQTLLFCAPVVAWSLAGERTRSVRVIATFAVGAACGLASYLFIPLFVWTSEEGAFVWGDPDSVAGLLDHVLRREYGTFRLAAGASELSPLHHALAFPKALPSQLFWLYFVAAGAGVVHSIRERRGLALALLSSIALAGVLFPMMFNVPQNALSAAVVERFQLLPLALSTPFVASGLHWMTGMLSRNAGWVVMLLPIPIAAMVALPHARWSSDPMIERYLVAAVRETDPAAVVIGEGDVTGMGVRWATEVLGERPDVEYLDLNLIRRRWYYDEASRRLPEGALPPYDESRTHLGDLIEAVGAHRPVHVTAWVAPMLGERHAPQPAGFFARVPRGDPLPLMEVERRLSRATAALGAVSLRPVDPWSASFRAAAALSWSALGKEYRAVGDETGAERCFAASLELARGR